MWYNGSMKTSLALALALCLAARAEWKRVESYDEIAERMTFTLTTTGVVSGVGSRSLAYQPRLVFTLDGPAAAKSIKEYRFRSGLCVAFAKFAEARPMLIFRFDQREPYKGRRNTAWEGYSAVFIDHDTFAMLSNKTVIVRYLVKGGLLNDVRFDLGGLLPALFDLKKRIAEGRARLPTTPVRPPKDPFRQPARNIPRSMWGEYPDE